MIRNVLLICLVVLLIGCTTGEASLTKVRNIEKTASTNLGESNECVDDCSSDVDCLGNKICNNDCCISPRCGDGSINQVSEICDGANLNGMECSDLVGYVGGNLECLNDCSDYHVSGCELGWDCSGSSLIGTPVLLNDQSAGFEPSGAVWHTVRNSLFVVNDEGYLFEFDLIGDSIIEQYNLRIPGSPKDYEGVTVADPDSHFIYLGLEQPLDSIKEFNVNTQQVTRTFDLSSWMIDHTSDKNIGLEALTFVPDESSPEGGYFYAGHQHEGIVYIFELPIKTSSSSESVNLIGTLSAPVIGRDRVQGLHYDQNSQVLFVLDNMGNKIRAMQLDGIELGAYTVTGVWQEGITLAGCGLIMADDKTGLIRKYPVIDCLYGCR